MVPAPSHETSSCDRRGCTVLPFALLALVARIGEPEDDALAGNRYRVIVFSGIGSSISKETTSKKQFWSDRIFFTLSIFSGFRSSALARRPGDGTSSIRLAIADGESRL